MYWSRPILPKIFLVPECLESVYVQSLIKPVNDIPDQKDLETNPWENIQTIPKSYWGIFFSSFGFNISFFC